MQEATFCRKTTSNIANWDVESATFIELFSIRFVLFGGRQRKREHICLEPSGQKHLRLPDAASKQRNDSMTVVNNSA